MITTERWLTRYVPAAGQHAVDVGCFRGLWSIELAKRFKKVTAIDVELKFLVDEIPANVTTIEKAIGDGGETVLERFANRPHFVNHRCAPVLKSPSAAPEELTIETTRLDELIRESVDFIKLDVEGAEVAALHGAANIINAYRPPMIVECHSDRLIAGVFDLLVKWGYEAEVIRNPRREDGTLAWSNHAHIFGNGDT